jgi:hypothetical protein
MSAGGRAFAESLGQFGQSIQNLGDTIYKVDADNIVKNKSLEYMQQVKEFNDSLLQDPDHGMPGQMSGYMLKWNDLKNKLMNDAQQVQNPLARKNLLQYVGQVSTDQYEKVSAYQFQNWSKSMIAAAQQRIETTVNDSTLTTKDKMDYMARELTDLRNFNIISPGEEQNIVQQYGQQIMVNDAKSQVLDALKTNGYGAATQKIVDMVGQSYTALGQTFTYSPENINGLMSLANVWENNQDKANQIWLYSALGKALKGDPSDFTIENINAHPTSNQAYFFEQFKELNPAGAADFNKYLKVKDAIRTNTTVDGQAIDLNYLSSLSFKDKSYQLDLYKDWAAKQGDEELGKILEPLNNLMKSLVPGQIVNPKEPMLTPEFIEGLNISQDKKITFQKLYWDAEQQIENKAQTDNNAKIVRAILYGTATRDDVLASDPEHVAQNYSLWLSTRNQNDLNAEDSAAKEILGDIFTASKNFEGGKDITNNLTDIGKKIEANKNILKASTYDSINTAYLKLNAAAIGQSSTKYLTETVLPGIQKNTGDYTLEKVLSDPNLTFEDRIKAASALDLSNRQGIEREGIRLAMNLSNLANGLPLEIPNKNLPVNLGPKKYDGMIERGNLDLNHRPVVGMPDGSIATVRSITIEEDGQYILIPTISKDGRVLTNDQAIEEYHNTGEHLGVFNSEEAADKYANELHESQAKLYEGATNNNILTEDWLNEHKGQLSDQTYSTLFNALNSVKAHAYVEATEDSINNSIRNYKNNAYAKGAGDATEKDEIVNIIDNARVLTPEKRAALKDSLDTIDLNADKIEKQREDEAFQAESQEHERGNWKLEAQQQKDKETKNNSASAKFSAFMQNLPNADTKTAQSNYDQFVKDIWGIYNNDPNTANTWIHAADVQLATRLTANYATIDKRLSDAFDEYIKSQTIPGYKPTGEKFTEQLVKDLFPNATDTDNKMRDYWLNKKLTFDNSKEALDAKAAPGKIEFSDKMRNMWDGLFGIPGYDPNNVIGDDWFQTENAKNLDPNTYHQYSLEFDSYKAAAEAKKTQEQKATQPGSTANKEVLPLSEQNKAKMYLGILKWIASVAPAQGSTYGAGTTAPSLTFTIDGKPFTVMADKATFDAIEKNNATLFIEAGLLGDVGEQRAKMMNISNNKNYAEVDEYIKSKFGKPDKNAANYMNPDVQNILRWLDVVKTNNPTPTLDDIAKIKKVIDDKTIKMELPKEFNLQQGAYDTSERYLEGAQNGDFNIFMTMRDGAAVPSYKDFEPIFNAWKASSLKYINQTLPDDAKLKEGQNATAVSYLDGSVQFVVDTKKNKAILKSIGDDNSVTSLRFYMGLYGKDALPIMEKHHYDEKTKKDTISVYAYVPWLDTRNNENKWVPVVGTNDNGISRYVPKNPDMFKTVSQSTSGPTIKDYGLSTEMSLGTE